jgi:hypothetical protein
MNCNYKAKVKISNKTKQGCLLSFWDVKKHLRGKFNKKITDKEVKEYIQTNPDLFEKTETLKEEKNYDSVDYSQLSYNKEYRNT